MIKKNTKAIFIDGDYAGNYDWKGGIPLSEGEIMTVEIDGKILQYRLDKKEVTFTVAGEDQLAGITYTFKSS